MAMKCLKGKLALMAGVFERVDFTVIQNMIDSILELKSEE